MYQTIPDLPELSRVCITDNTVHSSHRTDLVLIQLGQSSQFLEYLNPGVAAKPLSFFDLVHMLRDECPPA
jgi:hypothetical protein